MFGKSIISTVWFGSCLLLLDKSFGFVIPQHSNPHYDRPRLHHDENSPSSSLSLSSLVSTTTRLFPHSFMNGGYDASKASSVTWNPMQAAEFVLWHVGKPSAAGSQLAPMIPHWTGSNVGEFLTRLYLGEKPNRIADDDTEDDLDDNDDDNNNSNNSMKLSFESKNVRTPQWYGLEHDGLQALKELLSSCLADSVLTPTELARCAESFLLKEHTWPCTTSSTTTSTLTSSNKRRTIALSNKDGKNSKDSSTTTILEKDSFAALGYSQGIAQVLGSIYLERHGRFSALDVIEMMTLPEHSPKDYNHLQSRLGTFFEHLGIALTLSEKVQVVQGMAKSGWEPGTIAKFISTITEMDEVTVATTTVTTSTTTSTTMATNFVLPAPSSVSSSYMPFSSTHKHNHQKTMKKMTLDDDDDDDDDENDNDNDNDKVTKIPEPDIPQTTTTTVMVEKEMNNTHKKPNAGKPWTSAVLF